jgi:hypothetical protein
LKPPTVSGPYTYWEIRILAKIFVSPKSIVESGKIPTQSSPHFEQTQERAYEPTMDWCLNMRTKRRWLLITSNNT